MNEKALFELEDLLKLLPHRPPFLFVDRVVKLTPQKSIVAERLLRPEEPYFAGHFPGRPIMPGVLIAEALAQTSGLLIGHDRATPAMFFLAATNIKFTHPAVPGETLVMRATADRNFGALFRFQVEASAGRNLIASGSLTLALAGENAGTSPQEK